MKFWIAFLGLLLSTSISTANQSNLDVLLHRALIIEEILVFCQNPETSKFSNSCKIALEEALKVKVTQGELARAIQIRNSNSIDRSFDEELHEGLDEADFALVKHIGELLTTLEYNKQSKTNKL